MTNQDLRDKIDALIKANGVKAITGDIMNEILNDVVNTYELRDINMFYQDTTPTALSINDLWYAPTARILSIWTGTSWDDMQLTSFSQGSDVTLSDYLTLEQGKNVYFVDGSGEIKGIDKTIFSKGNRITIIAPNGSTLKHNIPGTADEPAFWFWTKKDLEVTTDYFSVDFELLELSTSVKTALGVTDDYIWGAIETGITGDSLLKDIFIELGEAFAWEVDATTEITGFPAIEPTYTFTHSGTAVPVLDDVNNKVTFSSGGTFYNFKILNDLGAEVYHIPGQEGPRVKATDTPVLTVTSIWDVIGKNELVITNWTGLQKVTDYFYNHSVGSLVVEYNDGLDDLIYNLPLFEDGTYHLLNAFESTWNITAGETFTFPATGANNFLIDWGDGSDYDRITTANPTHTYVDAGEYRIRVSGIMPIFNCTNNTSIKSVESIGYTGISGTDGLDFNSSSIQSFNSGGGKISISGNSLFAYNNINYCDLTGINLYGNIFGFLRSTPNLNTLLGLNEIDFTGISSLSSVFHNCGYSGVYDFRNSLNGKTALVSQMFEATPATEIYFENFSYTKSSSNDLVRSMPLLTMLSLVNCTCLEPYLFRTVNGVATPLTVDLTGFSFPSATSMEGFITGVSTIVDLIGVEFLNVSNITNFNNVFGSGKLPTATYDRILNQNTGWPSRTIPTPPSPGISEMDFGTSQYSLSDVEAVAGRAALVAAGWVVIDGGGI